MKCCVTMENFLKDICQELHEGNTIRKNKKFINVIDVFEWQCKKEGIELVNTASYRFDCCPFCGYY